MNKIHLSILIICFQCAAFAQGIDFFHGSWEDAVRLAQKEGKAIFVDAYAKWCGPCKRMARNVFTDETVGDYYNSNFINLKIDMEESMGRQFRRDYPVSAYPTLYFIDEQGEVLRKVVGGRRTEQFIALGKEIIAAYDRSGAYAEKYEEGDRSFDLVLNYVKSLNQANKPSLKIVNDYLRSNPEISGAQRAEFLYESLLSADSKVYDHYIDELDSIIKLKGEEAAMNKIEEACQNTVQTAINYEVEELLIEAQNKMKKNFPKKYKAFKLTSDFDYAQSTNDLAGMTAVAKELCEELYDNNPDKQVEMVEELMLYKSIHAPAGVVATEIAEELYKKHTNAKHGLLYAKLLAEHGDSDKALKVANKALKKSEEGEPQYKALSAYIDQLKS